MSMVQQGLMDHLMVVLIAIVLPVGGFISVQKVRRQVAAGIAYTTRATDYRNNILVLWAVTLLVLILWITLDRDWSLLGIAPVQGSAVMIGIALLLAGVLVCVNAYYYRRVEESDTAAQQIVAATAGFEMFLPHTHRDLRWFYGLSVTAGITEEILYRGFLIAYLVNVLPLAAAAVVSSLIFASAHLYQGLQGAARTFVVGLAMASIYLLSGSLLFAIIAHILVDIIGGRMIFNAFNRYPPAATAQETC